MQNTLEFVDMVNFLYERATKEVKMNFEVGMEWWPYANEIC